MFPTEIQYFAEAFVEIQRWRHRADYDPDVTLARANAIQIIDMAEEAILRFLQAPARDRRAFAIYVLLPARSN